MFSAFRVLAAVPALALLWSAASAQAEARSLLSAEAQAEWNAVGRLNVGGQGHCSGALIAPDLVLTAAHCLDNARTGAIWRAERLHFLPGWRIGTYAAHLVGEAHAFPADPQAPGGDIALIRVAPAEGSDPAPAPLPVGRAPDRGETVAVISYGMNRAEAPSIERGCTVTGRQGPLIMADCEAVPGVSGAPMLRLSDSGAELVGVVFAAYAEGSLAVAAVPHLAALQTDLENAAR